MLYNMVWELKVQVPQIYLGHFGPQKRLWAGGRPPGGLLTEPGVPASRSHLVTWQLPSSWRPSPGSHLGSLHRASFVTRWLGTRGRMRNALSHWGEARSAPRGASLATGGSRGPTRSPGVGHPPQVYPARVADPTGSSAEPKTEPAHAPRSPHVTHRLPGSYPHCLVPLSAASRCRKRRGPEAAPRSAAPTRAHDARPRPEVPASASVSLAA